MTDLTPPEETPPGSVRVTVFMAPEAWEAVCTASVRDDMTRTDVMNQAALAWNQLSTKKGRPFTLTPSGGEAVTTR